MTEVESKLTEMISDLLLVGGSDISSCDGDEAAHLSTLLSHIEQEKAILFAPEDQDCLDHFEGWRLNY